MKLDKRGFPVDKFKEFVKKSGATILKPTNQYEELRFTCNEGVGVLYMSEKSHVTLTGSAVTACKAGAGIGAWSL